MQRPKINNIRKLHIQKQPLLAGGCFFGEKGLASRWLVAILRSSVCGLYVCSLLDCGAIKNRPRLVSNHLLYGGAAGYCPRVRLVPSYSSTNVGLFACLTTRGRSETNQKYSLSLRGICPLLVPLPPGEQAT